MKGRNVATQTQEREYTWLGSSEFLRQHKGVIGVNKFYELIGQNALPHIRVGRKLLVRSDALDVLFERQTSGE
jgi:hypothetical protein